MTSPEPSKDQLKALWEPGFPLDRAWLEFSLDFDRIMLRALQTYPENDRMFERAQDEAVRNRYQELKHWLPPTFEARQIKLRNAIAVQRSYLLDNLYAGELWAIGFRTLASGFDEVVRVPRQHFFTDYEGERDVRPNIHWAKGELTVGNDSYFDIRVVAAPATKTADSDGRNDDGQTKGSTIRGDNRTRRGGRTRTADLITTTARDLWTTKPEFRTLPLKLMVGEVRAAIHGEESRNLELVNYKSSSMEKVIAEALKSKRSPRERKKPKEQQ